MTLGVRPIRRGFGLAVVVVVLVVVLVTYPTLNQPLLTVATVLTTAVTVPTLLGRGARRLGQRSHGVTGPAQ